MLGLFGCALIEVKAEKKDKQNDAADRQNSTGGGFGGAQVHYLHQISSLPLYLSTGLGLGYAGYAASVEKNQTAEVTPKEHRYLLLQPGVELEYRVIENMSVNAFGNYLAFVGESEAPDVNQALVGMSLQFHL